MMSSHLQRYTLVLIVVIFTVLPGVAKTAPIPSTEQILTFSSAITVNPDASLLVCEKIKVRGMGNTIKHGIYREFPLTYRDSQGHMVHTGFRIVGIKRDGVPEGYHTQTSRDHLRVYIGKKDTVLAPGVYSYTLTYKTTRQLAFLRDTDELYWNVTGHEWGFPIARAMATVRLPKNIPHNLITTTAYTGREGSMSKTYLASINAQGLALFSTIKPLKAREGLAIKVTFPKGHLKSPADTSVKNDGSST